MRRAYRGFVLVPALILCGCGGGAPTTGTTLPAAQHGGIIVALPGGKGFAEILAERGSVGLKTTVKTTAKRRLLAYFYQPDGSAALTPAPTDVQVRLGSAETGQDVRLTPQSTPPGLFASEVGQYPDDLRGRLDLTLGGESMKVDFMFR